MHKEIYRPSGDITILEVSLNRTPMTSLDS